MSRRRLIAAALVGALLALLLPPASHAAQLGTRSLKLGSQGADVTQLQRDLVKLGYSTPVDGVYGVDTKRSVKRLERKRSWRVDGKVSRKDASRIAKLAAKKAKKPGTIFYHHGLTEPTVTLSGLPGGSTRLEVVEINSGVPVNAINVLFDSSSETVSWDGRYSGGAYAPDGSYRITVADAGSAEAAIGGGQKKPFRLRLHQFPVPGPHDYGGAASRFGASRPGHTHQGQDMSAACGEKLYAAAGGILTTKAYQAGGAGYYMVIQGAATNSSYVYMHMIKPTWASEGQAVYAGQQLGKVGNTGSSFGCHLHFERWTSPGWYIGGRPYDPLNELRYWDAYS